MIFNRTSGDVLQAIEIRKNKISQGITPTTEELATMERGSFTINTANRVEDKQAELKIRFNDMGYYNFSITNKSWQYGDIFYDSDLRRLTENTAILRRAFFALPDTPTNPRAEYHYREMNLMEKVLYDLDSVANFSLQNYKICGDFECGDA
jgi:hypothetical protein